MDLFWNIKENKRLREYKYKHLYICKLCNDCQCYIQSKGLQSVKTNVNLTSESNIFKPPDRYTEIPLLQ